MKKMTMTLAALVLAGCIDVGSGPSGADLNTKTNANARFLCVGMETSRRFGSCPGCEIDAKKIASILSKSFGYTGDMLISSQATKYEVVSRLKKGIDETPEDGLFLFCYSGHGGQEYLGGKEPDGSDRDDEYLCLYDTYMQDDEIWDIVSKCRGRVFLYFDACHSATMYRSVASDGLAVFVGEARALQADNLVKSSGFHFRPEDFLVAEALSSDGKRSNQVRILCWSGCKEAQYSYGGSDGGVMTKALYRNWRKGVSYSDLWSKIVKAVQAEQPTQNPVQTKIGTGFGDGTEAFK